MDYKTLDVDQKAQVVESELRMAEEEHFRLTLRLKYAQDTERPGLEAHLARLEERVKDLQQGAKAGG